MSEHTAIVGGPPPETTREGQPRFDPSQVDELTREHAKALHDALAHLGYCGKPS